MTIENAAWLYVGLFLGTCLGLWLATVLAKGKGSPEQQAEDDEAQRIFLRDWKARRERVNK
jgi:hypothetical protein